MTHPWKRRGRKSEATAPDAARTTNLSRPTEEERREGPRVGGGGQLRRNTSIEVYDRIHTRKNCA